MYQKQTTNTGHNNEEKKNLKSVIDCRESARSWYTPKRMFIYDRMEKYLTKYVSVSREERANKEQSLSITWNKVSKTERSKWEAEARRHDEEWASIKDRIILSLQNNGSKGFQQVEADIGGWCSHTTIAKWLKQHETYTIYTERIIPLLTTEQKNKQHKFASHLTMHWGLPAERLRKVLWVHYDEKWFWGMVARSNAKKCDEIGLARENYYAYHKNYVNKVMVLAITGYAFENHIENGGHGIKLALVRIQAAKIAKKTQRKGVRDENGALHYTGEVIRRKGDVYMADVNVTGSDSGTSDNPKFSLMSLFAQVIFPRLQEITGPGGKYEGYVPIIQGDNAGPHQDTTFQQYMTSYCNQQGWYSEPQAAQMPYINNLDLSVFPMMSKKHSALLKEHSNTVPSTDKIYQTAEDV